jgi:hypothetical protein
MGGGQSPRGHNGRGLNKDKLPEGKDGFYTAQSEVQVHLAEFSDARTGSVCRRPFQCLAGVDLNMSINRKVLSFSRS